MDRPVVYAKRFPASHAWLIRERIDQVLAELPTLPAFMGDLQEGECVVLVKLSAASSKEKSA